MTRPAASQVSRVKTPRLMVRKTPYPCPSGASDFTSYKVTSFRKRTQVLRTDRLTSENLIYIYLPTYILYET